MSRPARWLFPALLAIPPAAQSDPATPAAPKPEQVLEVGTVHPVASASFQDGVIVVGGGRILAIGPRGKVEVPPNVPVLALPTAHAYPGLVDAWSLAFVPPGGFGEGSAGLDAAAGLDRTADGNEMLAAGITTAHVAAAASGRWLGTGALVHPRAQGFASFAPDSLGAMFLRLTSAPGQHPVARRKDLTDLGRGFDEATAHAKAVAKYADAVAKYEKDWQAYLEALRKGGAKPADTPPASASGAPAGEGTAPARPAGPTRPTFPKAPTPDPSKTALERVAAGGQRLWIEAQRRDEIGAALALVQERGLRHAAVLGALSGSAMLDELARAGVGVVLAPTGLPAELDGEPVADSLAADLHAKGIPFAIASGDAGRARALTLMAAACVGQGVPEDVAIRALTLTPAELLGITAHVGSLERGKRADLLITSAPLLRSDARLLRVLAGGETLYQGR